MNDRDFHPKWIQIFYVNPRAITEWVWCNVCFDLTESTTQFGKEVHIEYDSSTSGQMCDISIRDENATPDKEHCT